jgi:hypothetical protein
MKYKHLTYSFFECLEWMGFAEEIGRFGPKVMFTRPL